ncbi:MAG: hypothetical protein HQK78_05570 [Desulfobacterales bacterium]|nr:hypothetical protein [Desulfobacterales bacterium]
MTDSWKRWETQDRFGNVIYLSHERWNHIVDEINHPEMENYEDYIKLTLQKGHRKQEPLNPRKYRYYEFFEDLPGEVNMIVAIVLFGYDVNEHGETISNNFLATAFFKHVRK